MRELPVRAGFDVVAIAQETAATAGYGELRSAAVECLRRVDALNRKDA
jgi:hypothetical protein